jgi:hypothetical protein
MEKESNNTKKKTNLALPIGLAIFGLCAIGLTAYLLIKKSEEEEEIDYEVEHYDAKSVPIL